MHRAPTPNPYTLHPTPYALRPPPYTYTLKLVGGTRCAGPAHTWRPFGIIDKHISNRSRLFFFMDKVDSRYSGEMIDALLSHEQWPLLRVRLLHALNPKPETLKPSSPTNRGRYTGSGYVKT